MGANDPKGKTNSDPRGLIGRIYVGDRKTFLHTKYISCGPHGFREKESFIFFFHCKSMGANDPLRHGQFGPQRHGWQDSCRRPPNIATY